MSSSSTTLEQNNGMCKTDFFFSWKVEDAMIGVAILEVIFTAIKKIMIEPD